MSGFAGVPLEEMAAARAAHAGVIAPPGWKRVLPFLLALLVLAYLAFLWSKLGLTLDLFARGFGKLGTFIAEMVPPDPGPYTAEFLTATGETLGMAFLGTLMAAIIAYPLGFLGAGNVVRNPVIHFAMRRLFDIFRGIPAIIWALIFVGAFGLGPMAGVLALMMSDFAALSKLNAEAIENADHRPVEGVRSTGATFLQTLRFGLVPQVLPVQLGQALYFFESNVRSAAVLGIVGAGGIGYYLSDLARNNHWEMVSFILIIFLILVALIDVISRRLRERIIGKRA